MQSATNIAVHLTPPRGTPVQLPRWHSEEYSHRPHEPKLICRTRRRLQSRILRPGAKSGSGALDIRRTSLRGTGKSGAGSLASRALLQGKQTKAKICGQDLKLGNSVSRTSHTSWHEPCQVLGAWCLCRRGSSETWQASPNVVRLLLRDDV